MQLREVRLVGSGKTPASVKFTAAANVISGNSDTGKSYILRCVDFVLGAEELKKKIDEAEGYELIQLEFVNGKGDFLTLVRNVNGGDVQVHRTPIDAIQGDGETVAWKRQGQSAGADVTAIFLPFANMPEAKLFSGGSKQPVRLTVRTLMPAFIVDEGSIIAERSPVYGDTGFDNPARKRMLSFLLTGHDDAGIIVEKKREIVRAETNAKIALIDDMLKELRADAAVPNPSDSVSPNKEEQPISTIDRADAAIQRLSSSLAEDREERARLQMERSDALKATQAAEAQIIAINELLTRYDLLAKRYDSDLERLDFVSEGSYYLNQLQDARCPLCDQVMDESHREHVSGAGQIGRVYSSAKAEAGKINGLKADLASTVEDLARRRESRNREFANAAARMEEIDRRIDRDLAPALQRTKADLDELIQRRLDLENVKATTDRIAELRTLRQQLEASLQQGGSARPKISFDTAAVNKFCLEIENVLKSWHWPGPGRVTFEESDCDIIVDGRKRISHGKGIRAILHAAFIIGLLYYSKNNGTPHPRFVVLDSPLTTFKQKRDRQAQVPGESTIDPGLEAGFWSSLPTVPSDIQVIVLENKEPPDSVASSFSYQWFAGDEAKEGERGGFIPA